MDPATFECSPSRHFHYNIALHCFELEWEALSVCPVSGENADNFTGLNLWLHLENWIEGNQENKILIATTVVK